MDQETLERKFQEKSEEIQQLQQQYQEIGNRIQQGIGELRAYQELFQESGFNQEVIEPDFAENNN